MSSPYTVLDNKSIDQLKVTELKEELKKRKLATKGLKDELIRRLDEALRAEKDVDAENESGFGKEDDISNEKGTEKEAAAAQNVKITEKEELSNNEMDEKEELANNDMDEKEELANNDMDTERKKEAVINERDTVDEVLNKERDSAKDEVDNGFDCEVKLQVKREDGGPKVIGAPVVSDSKVQDDSGAGKLDTDVSMVDIDRSIAKMDQESMGTIDTVKVVSHTTVVDTVETKITESRSVVNIASSGVESQNNEIKDEKEDSLLPHEDAVLNDSSLNNQVSEVSPSLGFQVKSDSISTASVSINQKNELKDNLNADNFHIELDNVKPEMVQPSSSDVPRKGGDINPLDDQEPSVQQGSLEEREDINATNMDLGKKNDSADGGSSEKLNLDRSSGDDSMEEDILESKQVESNHITDEVVRTSEVTLDHVMKEESLVDATGVGFAPGMKDVTTENKSSAAAPVEKRKLEDQEIVRNNEPPKRQRRWNTETLKVPDQLASTLSPLTTPKAAFQSKVPNHSFNRSNSTLSAADAPKERVVPPSPKPPTTSLKIDNFLRPFTLKAVHELLGKTGTICSFWMDHIKTHCFVTFSSVDEAVETRNALYNLQWPANGGRHLVAEFVDPQEVKERAEASPQPLTVPISSKPAPPPSLTQPQPPPRQNNVLKQQLPPPPSILPPPPPLSDPHTVRERLPIPPTPPLIKKPDPPIVTLDDLFKKTRATPRIYYLPLSEEQVREKVVMQGKSNN